MGIPGDQTNRNIHASSIRTWITLDSTPFGSVITNLAGVQEKIITYRYPPLTLVLLMILHTWP